MTIPSSTVRSCIVATVALASGAVPLAGQGRVPLRHPAGFSVSLPQGWKHVAVDDTRLRLMPPGAGDDEALLLIGVPADGVTSVVDRAFLERSDSDVQGAYPTLRRIGAGKPIRNAIGDGVRLTFEGQGPRELACLVIYAVVRNDMAMTLFAAGSARQITRRMSELDGVFATLRLDPVVAPGASAGGSVTDGSRAALEWSARIGGQKLTVLSGYGSTGSAGGMTSRSDLILLRNGRFSYTSSSSVSIPVDWMSGGSSGQEADSGRWRILSRNGRAVLSLTDRTGGRREMELTRNGSQTFLNGTRAFVTAP